MPLDKKRPRESHYQSTNEPNVKNKKLTQLFGLSDSEEDDADDKEQDFDNQPTLVIPRTQPYYPSESDEDDVTIIEAALPTPPATATGKPDIGQSQSQIEMMTGGSEFTVIPATPTTQGSVATVSSGFCPDSAEQFSDSATLLLLSYFTDSHENERVKRNYTQVDKNGGQGQQEVSTAKKARVDGNPDQMGKVEDTPLIKPIGFFFRPLVLPSELRRRPISFFTDGHTGEGGPNFKTFKKVMPNFTTAPPTPISFVVHSEIGESEIGRRTSSHDRRRTILSTPVSFFGLPSPNDGGGSSTHDPSCPERDEFSFDDE